MKHKRNYPKAFAKAFKNHCEMAVLTGRLINMRIKKLTHFIGSYFISYEKLADRICLSQIAEDIDLTKLAECYDIESIADEIDHQAVANHVDLNDLAEAVDNESIAYHIELSELVNEIDYDEIASCVDASELAQYLEIDYSELDFCYSTLVDYFDYDVLAESISADSDACREIADKVNAKVIASHVQDPWSMMVTPFEKEH